MNSLSPDQLSHVRVERVIAGVRVLLATSSLFAIWLDPTEPASHVALTYSLHASYVVLALLIAAIMWRRDSSGWLPIATHVADVVIASVFQYLTLGPSSPFFLYFVFSLFSAALRWGWKQTIWTAAVELATFVAMSVSLSRTMAADSFDLNRFVIRFVYLIVIGGLLAYLGQHEARLRENMRLLAQWPQHTGELTDAFVHRVLTHAAGILGAAHATLVWSANDEPWVYVATWPPAPTGGATIQRYAPADFEPLVPEPLTSAVFLSAATASADAPLLVSREGAVRPHRGSPAHAQLLPLLIGVGLASAPFEAEHRSGRIFFTGVRTAGANMLPLTEVIAREIGASLDRLSSAERSRDLAIVEDRIRVARDLHDGVLQALTGIRFELQSIATAEQEAVRPVPVADRLLAIERALAIEQRELRRFVEGLKPGAATPGDSPLADRLEQVRGRLAAEWKTAITLRTHLTDAELPREVQDAIALMAQEAAVNALKHGNPSRVTIDVRRAGDRVTLIVTDDGRGFPFTGRYEEAALAAANIGPVSLRERAASLGATLALESDPKGTRIEIDMPVRPVHA